eukprot:1720684-Rhodomonas_salina.1
MGYLVRLPAYAFAVNPLSTRGSGATTIAYVVVGQSQMRAPYPGRRNHELATGVQVGHGNSLRARA